MFIPIIIKDYLNKRRSRKDLYECLITLDYSYDTVLAEFLDTAILLCAEEGDESCFRFQLFALIERYNERMREM